MRAWRGCGQIQRLRFGCTLRRSTRQTRQHYLQPVFPQFFKLLLVLSSTITADQTRKAQRSNMSAVVAVGIGVAAAAFFVSAQRKTSWQKTEGPDSLSPQGRAGLVAFRKYRGGITAAGALGKSFYKGGFEPKMNRREAALILQLR